MDRILLVEDHPAMRELVVRELARSGIAADTVGRVSEAEASLAQVRYGALVLDRGLPEGDALPWLQRLRDLCTQYGSMLIIDEVKTGFRVAKGGAQALYGIHADLTTYAKAMGNGYPVAAFGGRAEVMDVVGSNKGGVVHGGTYTANLVALSAAHATLNILDQTDALATINRVGDEIRALLGRVFTAAGVEHAFAGPPAMLGIHFTPVVGITNTPVAQVRVH
jgi:glutamate-1-semialdehyde aminotransferase